MEEFLEQSRNIRGGFVKDISKDFFLNKYLEKMSRTLEAFCFLFYGEFVNNIPKKYLKELLTELLKDFWKSLQNLLKKYLKKIDCGEAAELLWKTSGGIARGILEDLFGGILGENPSQISEKLHGEIPAVVSESQKKIIYVSV